MLVSLQSTSQLYLKHLAKRMSQYFVLSGVWNDRGLTTFSDSLLMHFSIFYSLRGTPPTNNLDLSANTVWSISSFMVSKFEIRNQRVAICGSISELLCLAPPTTFLFFHSLLLLGFLF